MNKFHRTSLLAAVSAVVLMFSASAFGATTITIQNADSAGVGFNDTTPVAPVGNNPGTTLGQQRLNAFQFAANIWGAILNSNTPIVIHASWASLTCTANSAVLGQAGAAGIILDFPNAPFPGTWFSIAEGNALAGSDLNGATQEINAQFNVNLGNTGCLEGSPFYLGLDNNHGANTDLVTVLLHEFSHGLGFQTFTSGSSGTFTGGLPSIYDRFLFDDTSGQTWAQMSTDSQRQSSAINTNNLTWNGPQVTADAHNILATPLLKVNSPAGIAGNYAVGTASFGPALTSGGITATMVQALDPSDGSGALTTDGCSALTNGATVSGKIAFIDRGTCTFVIKVKNAQNAGAIGVVIADNAAGSPPPGLGGSDSTITIPAVRITQADGNTIRPQLGTANATLFLNTAVPGGADAQGRALLFAPNPIQGGSSVSHWDTSEFPNQLMEPSISGDLTHGVAPIYDLTLSQLKDIGWQANAIGDNQFFVRQHYLDFLNREPDGGGLRFWADSIYSCGIDQSCVDVKRINASAAYFLSIEFQQTGNLVYKMYKAGFGNLSGKPVPVLRANFMPDTQQIQSTPAQVIVGQGNWQTQLETNKQAFALAFVQRAAFQSAHGSQNANTYVASLFNNAGVASTGAETTAAVTAFNSAGGGDAGRAAGLRSVADSNSVSNALFNESFVLMQYFGYLQRNPYDPPEPTLDYQGYNFWLNKLNSFGGNYNNAEMVKSFIISSEYRQRFGQ